MRLTYDPRHKVAYIQFRDRSERVKTVQISNELNVDLAPDGSVYGIELLNANEQLSADGGKLVVVNQPTGERTEIPLNTA